MKRLNIQIQQRSTVPPELCGLKKPRHSLCCNGHTRQRFAATREQIAAKYLNTEITGLLAANTAKVEKSASMKM